MLSANERIQAQRFRQQQDRMRFIVTRAALCRLLAERVMTSSDHWHWQINPVAIATGFFLF